MVRRRGSPTLARCRPAVLGAAAVVFKSSSEASSRSAAWTAGIVGCRKRPGRSRSPSPRRLPRRGRTGCASRLPRGLASGARAGVLASSCGCARLPARRSSSSPGASRASVWVGRRKASGPMTAWRRGTLRKRALIDLQGRSGARTSGGIVEAAPGGRKTHAWSMRGCRSGRTATAQKGGRGPRLPLWSAPARKRRRIDPLPTPMLTSPPAATAGRASECPPGRPRPIAVTSRPTASPARLSSRSALPI